MGTPAADNFKLYFSSKRKAGDGQALTTYVTDAGSTKSAIIDNTLASYAVGYWDEAIGWFLGDTTTTALRGQFFHVKTYETATGTLITAKALPSDPVAGDTFKLVIGGKYRTTEELFGLSLDGTQPELINSVGSDISGLTITKASPKLESGIMTVFYDSSLQELYIRVGTDDYGVGLDVSGDVTDGYITDCSDNGWIRVDVASGSLPVADQSDTYTVAKPERTLTPDYEGYQTSPNLYGYTRYRLEVGKNEHATDSMQNLGVYSSKPLGTATTIAVGGVTTVSGNFEATDVSDWPVRGWWMKNTTLSDCRYINYRSGNDIYFQAVNWATLDFETGSIEIEKDDIIADETSGATAIVDQVTLTSGTWGGGDAAGTLLLKKVVSIFGTGNNIQISSVTQAVCDGDSALGLRGYTTQTWSVGNAIVPMSDVDIGSQEPTANLYANPATAYTAPDDIVFSDYDSQSDSISMGELAAGDHYGVWRREWIQSDSRARDDVDTSNEFFWG